MIHVNDPVRARINTPLPHPWLDFSNKVLKVINIEETKNVIFGKTFIKKMYQCEYDGISAWYDESLLEKV